MVKIVARVSNNALSGMEFCRCDIDYGAESPDDRLRPERRVP